jgi:outer membrane protein assembly factor BamE (lipoprotein component of BamABCDE complex)
MKNFFYLAVLALTALIAACSKTKSAVIYIEPTNDKMVSAQML